MCNDNIDFGAFNDKCNKLEKEYKSIDPTSCTVIDGTKMVSHQMLYDDKCKVYFIHDKCTNDKFSFIPKTSIFGDFEAITRFDEFIRSRELQDQTPN